MTDASGPDRRLHLVGSLPQFASAAEAFAWQTGELDGLVRRLTGGETGDRLRWFVPLVKDLQQHAAIATRRHGDWTGYDDTDRLTVRRGARLTPDDVPLRLDEWAHEELAVLDAAGTPASTQRPLQVGVPGHLDIALFTFGPAAGLRLAPVFRDALATRISRVGARDRVLFQLESPAALLAVAAAPRPIRPFVAGLMARQLIGLVTRTAPGTRFGVHLCLGDLGHRAARQLRDADPLVALANALTRAWPRDRPLEFVHLPLAAADHPPVLDPAFYAPLRQLSPALPRVVAGLVHEELDLTAQRQVLALAETAAGRRMDVASSCGLGRRSPGQARRAAELMVALLRSDQLPAPEVT